MQVGVHLLTATVQTVVQNAQDGSVRIKIFGLISAQYEEVKTPCPSIHTVICEVCLQ